jgi:hypothetical protein
MPGMITTLKSLLQRRLKDRQVQPTPLQRAQSLLDAIDAGGVPLSPAIVNRIARELGLDVSSKAPMSETIERIRAVVVRQA